MRGALPALLLFGLLLSGCVAEDPPAAPADGSSDATDDESTNTTLSAAPASDQPADDEASAASNTSANAAPAITNFTANASGLNVTFTFAAMDSDNDTLTYTLAFGDNSTNATGSLANGTANVTYLFAAAGAYNITLVVSDGDLGANQTLSLNLTAGKSIVAQEFDSEWLAGGFGCGLRPAGAGSIYEDTFVGVHDIDPATSGQAFTATFSTTPDFVGAYMEFRDDAFAELAGFEVDAAPWTIAGTIPEGAVWVSFTGCSALGGSVHYVTGS